MPVSEATALSDLERQYFIQQINGRAAEVVAQGTGAANTAALSSLITLETNSLTDLDLLVLSGAASKADLDLLVTSGAASKVDLDNLVTLVTTGNASLVTIAGSSAPVYTALNIPTSTTTLVKTGTGVLKTINVNSLGTVSSTVKIYDGLSAAGTLLGTINTLAVLGSLEYNATFTTGLCIVSTGTVAPDLTVVYR